MFVFLVRFMRSCHFGGTLCSKAADQDRHKTARTRRDASAVYLLCQKSLCVKQYILRYTVQLLVSDGQTVLFQLVV